MSTGYRAAVLIMAAVAANAQVSSNLTLVGKYFFRQVSVQTGPGATVTKTQSAWGTLTFDGSGGFTILGQQLTDSAPAANLSASGTYTVNPGGLVTMTNPLIPGASINARLGAQALMGSSTDPGSNIFDVLVALRGTVTQVTNQILAGPYFISSLELPGGGLANIRETNFELTPDTRGGFAATTVSGEAANLGGSAMTQPLSAGTYLINSDATGTMTFPSNGGTMNGQLIEGAKTIYVSSDGNFFIGGSTDAGGHGLLAGVRSWNGGNTGSNADNTSFTGFYFASGMRYDPASQTLSSMVSSVNPTSQGAVWQQHTRASDGSLADSTTLAPYSIQSDGSGSYPATQEPLDLAVHGLLFTESGSTGTAHNSYAFVVGSSALAQTPADSSPFLHPLGVFNAASYAPPGLPVSPGEFVSLFGNNLAAKPLQAGIPYPTLLGDTQLRVNGTFVPVYAVSPTQINAVVPYGITGSTATFVAIVDNTPSNAVILPLAQTAPGVFSLAANGLGDGAIEHADGSVVTASNPAKPGEIVEVYLTGLGAVSPTVQDGTAAPSNPPAKVTAPVTVYVGGVKVTNLQFDGLSPDLANLYQMNIEIPKTLSSGPQRLEIVTAQGSTSMVDVPVGAGQ